MMVHLSRNAWFSEYRLCWLPARSRDYTTEEFGAEGHHPIRGSAGRYEEEPDVTRNRLAARWLI
jgi:hypothetical protein